MSTLRKRKKYQTSRILSQRRWIEQWIYDRTMYLYAYLDTTAALLSESKVLVKPASVDSISTSASQEDHVSMGGFAARKAKILL